MRPRVVTGGAETPETTPKILAQAFSARAKGVVIRRLLEFLYTRRRRGREAERIVREGPVDHDLAQCHLHGRLSGRPGQDRLESLREGKRSLAGLHRAVLEVADGEGRG